MRVTDIFLAFLPILALAFVAALDDIEERRDRHRHHPWPP